MPTELVPWETKPSILGGYKLQDYLNKVGPVRKKNARFQCAGHIVVRSKYVSYSGFRVDGAGTP